MLAFWSAQLSFVTGENLIYCTVNTTAVAEVGCRGVGATVIFQMCECLVGGAGFPYPMMYLQPSNGEKAISLFFYFLRTVVLTVF